MLEARSLSKRYPDGVLALDSFDFIVPGGEMVFLLGANGAGKTTCINLFLDFLRPTSGAAFVDEIEVAASPLTAKRRVAYLPENVALYPDMTAEDNLRFFAKVAGRDDIDGGAIRAALHRVDLPLGRLQQRVKEFSKGMRQRLGLALALLTDVHNLVLDEPTSGLDPVSADSLMRLLRELRAAGTAILLSSHDLFRAKSFADRVIVLREGRTVAQLSREELGVVDLERLYLFLANA
jgi:ABC-2 type transport system ATP-binding protein